MKRKSERVKTVLLILLTILNVAIIVYYGMILKIKSDQVLEIKSQSLEQAKQIERLSEVEEKYKQSQEELVRVKKQNSDLKAETGQLYARIDNLKKSQDESVLIEYSILPIYIEGDAQKKDAMEAANYLKLLPDNLLLTLKEKGWSVVVTSKDIEDTYGSGVENTIGLTLYYQEKIYVLADSYAVQSCMLHEIGHVVDFMNDFISYGEEWSIIYDKEAKNSGYEPYFYKSASEYFAQAFQEYFLNGEALKVQGPNTYQFLKKIIESY